MSCISGYRVLYVLIHTVYTFFEFIWNTVTYIPYKLNQIYTETWFVQSDTDHFQKRLYNISKKPNHVTVILGVEEYTCRDLANLIFFCMAAAIPYISFYDFRGRLKKQEEKLQAAVDTLKLGNNHVIWHNQEGTAYKNGFTGRKTHIKIITEEVGRDSIVNLTKNIVLSKERDISIEKVHKNLQEKYEFPDPDMGLVFGKRMHILNYPPWQLRLTEFFRINSVSNITFSKFVEQLEKFAKCEQRVGT